MELVILYTNDLHGHILPYESGFSRQRVGGVAAMASLIRRVREEEKGKPVFWIDAGDTLPNHLLSDMTKGKPLVQILNLLSVDAFVLGNHDFDSGWGAEVLTETLREATFPILGCNIVSSNGVLPFLRPYTITESAGVKVAVIGAITPETPFYIPQETAKGLSFMPVNENVRKWMQEISRSEPDVAFYIVDLHDGPEAARALASSLPFPALIVGGHTHQAFPVPYRFGKSLYLQAGNHGRFLGRISLEIDLKKKSIVSHNNLLIPILQGEVPEDPEVSRLITEACSSLTPLLEEEIGVLLVDLLRNDRGESSLDNYIADVMRRETGADLAMKNSRSSRDHLLKGKVTMEKLYRILPWDEPILTVTLSAAGIKEALEVSVLDENFRGSHPDIIQVSGVKVTYDLTLPEWERVREVTVEVGRIMVKDGDVVRPEEEYTVATRSFLLQGGRGYSPFTRARDRREGKRLREALAAALRSHPPVAEELQGRLLFLT